MMYLIAKGKHYPEGWNLSGYALGATHCGLQTMTRTVMFTNSALVQPGIPDCDNDINKLFGWSYGYHHRNSIRVGWRVDPVRDQITLFLYMYENGNLRQIRLANVKANDAYDVTLMHNHSTGAVSLQARNTTFNRSIINQWKGGRPGCGYRLGLYHGGNCPAKSDIEIMIR